MVVVPGDEVVPDAKVDKKNLDANANQNVMTTLEDYGA